MTERPAVTVVGSLHVDLVATADRLPRRGESLVGHGFAMHPGGKGGNQASQVARCGLRAFLVTRLGDDLFGGELRRRLTEKGVDLTFAGVDGGASTGASPLFVGADGEYASIIVPGAAARLSPADIDAARPAFAASGAVMLQLEIPLQVSAYAGALAAGHGAMVVLNAAPAPSPPADLPRDLVRHVDLLVVNGIEAEWLGGGAVANPTLARVAAERLRESHGIPNVIVTLGAGGSVAATIDGTVHQPAWPVGVVDTVGAGDAFVGALVAEVVRGRSIIDALPFAAAAGALAATKAGAFDAIPTRDDIAAFVFAR